MDHEKILSGFLICDKFISVNRRLGKMKNGKMYLSPEYALEEQQLMQSLENSGLVRNSLDNSCFYALSLVFYLKENIARRDADNLVKNPVDCISRYLGFNDNRIISYKICKRALSDLPEGEPQIEYLYFEIEKVYKKKEDLTIPYEEFREFVRKKTGHDIFYKLSNKIAGKRGE